VIATEQLGEGNQVVDFLVVNGCNREEVWNALCGLIVNQTGVDREKVKPEARIVKDLGLD
jgi:hypothetical protein